MLLSAKLTMIESMLFPSAFLLGLFSAPHCLGMCGGLVSAIGLNSRDAPFFLRLFNGLKVNLGRLLSYATLGLLAGFLGMAFQQLLPGGGNVLRLVAGVLLVLMGLYISGWWLGLRHLEQAMYRVWQPLQGLLKHNNQWLSGILWGCMPCGLVYSALSMAMTQQTPWHGAVFMFSFGLGTLPALIGAGLFATTFAQWIRKQWVRTGAGVALMVYGVWTVVAVFTVSHGDHAAHAGHVM